MNHPWCKAIITEEDQADIRRCLNRLTLTMLMMTATINHLPEYFDKKLPQK